MTVSVALRHHTRYRYDRTVALGPHEIRLKPVPGCRTPVPSYALAVGPARHSLHWAFDAAGNHVARALFAERAAQLDIDVALVAELAPVNPFDFLVDPAAAGFPFRYEATALPDLAPQLAPVEDGPRLRGWLAGFRPAASTIETLIAVNQRLRKDIAYVTRHEHGVQSCEDTLRLSSGSCRDSGWLLVQLLRRLGVAARFVSGYLVQLKSAEPDGPKEDGADFHAWAEAWLPGAGWIGFDPTSGLLAAEGHIPLARSAAPALAAPVVGSVEPCKSEMEVTMSVQRL